MPRWRRRCSPVSDSALRDDRRCLQEEQTPAQTILCSADPGYPRDLPRRSGFMMVDESLQSLRRLAKRYDIRFRLPSEKWPEAHVTTFQAIKTLGRSRVDTYSQGIDIRLSQEPWKEQTKARAEWLTIRAGRLFSQERNEAGWRFGLENDVLRRFSVEVACPKCRARVWQSEIQAILQNPNDVYAQQLEERRKQRRPCQCPRDERFKDFYEIGINALFDDRAQEFVIYEDLLKSQLPKQGPDRVFGLQNTRNLNALLSSPVRPDIAKQPQDTVSDILKTTPFRAQTDPLLFPFLLLEAKSESSSCGFDAIQVQSAFPVRALLKLQEELQSYIPEDQQLSPLVWFFASRGDAWRVYGSYITKGDDEETKNYNIALLWSGSLLDRDDALQLVLIVDYIMDWARDIYRIAILRQLKSMVTAQPFDQISLVDSDMFSMHRHISNWIPAPPSTIVDELDESRSTMNENTSPLRCLDHQAMLRVRIPNTKFGSVRSSSLTNFRFVCLYLTERLIPSFLQVIGGRWDSKEQVEKAARLVINFVTQSNEVLVLSKAELDLLETLWTGVTRGGPDSTVEDFYVVIEASWYLNTSWEITRELSCVAISKSAFNVLKTHAGFRIRHKGIDNLPRSERRCPRQALHDCISCLRSGSPWQILLAAISCTLVTLYPLPVRRREDFAPPVEALGLDYIPEDRVRSFIMKFMTRNLWRPKSKRRIIPKGDLDLARRAGFTAEVIVIDEDKSAHGHTDMSWKRTSEQRTQILDEEHHSHDQCERCSQSPETNKSPFAHGYLDTRIPPILSDYGAMLIVSIEKPIPTVDSPYKADTCIFILEAEEQLEDHTGLSVVIEDLMQVGLVYHAIRYGPKDVQSSGTLDYNLPLPYRSITIYERYHLLSWICELRGEAEPKPSRDMNKTRTAQDEWKEMRWLLYYLRLGHTEQEATLLRRHKEPHGYKKAYGLQHDDEFRMFAVHNEAELSGSDLVQRFSSWTEGREFLKRRCPDKFQYLFSLYHNGRTAPKGSAWNAPILIG